MMFKDVFKRASSKESPSRQISSRKGGVSDNRSNDYPLLRPVSCLEDLRITGLRPQGQSQLTTKDYAVCLPISKEPEESPTRLTTLSAQSRASANAFVDGNPSLAMHSRSGKKARVELPKLEPIIRPASLQGSAAAIGPGASQSPGKVARIADQNENAKEAASVLESLSELGKLMKKRAKDISAIQALADAKGKLGGKEQQMESLLANVAARESARVVREGKKLGLLEQFIVEDKALKKIVITASKKMLRACEKYCLKREIERFLHSKLNGCTIPIEDQLSQIMAIPNATADPAPEKSGPAVPFTTNRSLFRVMHYVYKESTIDLVFIGKVGVLYTRMLLQRARELALRLCKKQLHKKKAPTLKPTNQAASMDDGTLYNKLIKDKVYGMLTTNNTVSFEDSQKYILEYRTRHPKK